MTHIPRNRGDVNTSGLANSGVTITADELARLRERAKRADELERVIRARDWTPAERIIYAMVIIAAQSGHVAGEYRLVDDGSASKLAAASGISERTAADALQRLEQAGLITRRVERTPTNRYGEEISTHSMDTRRGDYWRSHTSISVKPLPVALPALGDSANRTRARAQAAQKRREFAEMKAQLNDLLSGAACPHCGEQGSLRGEIRATCSKCGTIISERELRELIDGDITHTDEPRAQSLQSREMLAGQVDEPGMQSLQSREKPAGQADEPRAQSLQSREKPAGQADEPGVQSLQGSTVSNHANFAVQESTESGGGGIGEYKATLLGAASVEYLAALGARFSFAAPRSKRGINPRDDGAEINYLDAPVDEAAALRHLAQGGNIGLLPEHCQLAVIDVDAHADEFLARFPALAMSPRVFRRNAPDRAKIIVGCSDIGESKTFTSADGSRKIELIGRRKHAIVAGVHESGAAIELLEGYELICLSWTHLLDIARKWTGSPPNLSVSCAASVRTRASRATRGDIVHEAIEAWIAVPANRAEVDALLARCPRRGQYVAVRPDDDTPSSRRTDMRDGYHKRIWRDYGTGETLDDYELYCRLRGLDKRTHKWQIVKEYCRARGLRPPKLKGIT
ncbi:MAG: hypothetical protein RMN52_02290 [Anaerolineae bacterium]|nr:hypothetical protein [Candidatus Roseilinea sp.]MDW8448810.1 hypothetical protein [Anaerolineae bacterium]